MVSLERTKILLNDPTLSDKQATETRDAARAFAELMFEAWQQKREVKTLNAPFSHKHDVDRQLPEHSYEHQTGKLRYLPAQHS